jgi:quinol monooxygenase YgiN
MTIHATARFTVKEEELETALEAIGTFVAHTRSEPGTLRYDAFRSADRPSEFLHVMEFADEEAERAHGSSDAVKAFTAVLYPTCVEEPSFDRWLPVA